MTKPEYHEAPEAEILRRWRAAERRRLLAARQAIDRATLEGWRRRIDAHLESGFPGLARARLAFCWPIRNEYDARHLARRLRARGAVTALPVVVAPEAPLVFRLWQPGTATARGALGIPYPVASPEVVPDFALVPMIGWDPQGFRLGYGGGYFDRTLAQLAGKVTAIGVACEFARIESIRPQSWDVAMDYVVTERGLYRRGPTGLTPSPV